MRAVGLFGGSFNPIHNGHLHLAESVYQALALDSVVLMPTGEAPHKDCSAYAPAIERFAMCKLAAEKYPWMQVSDKEIRKEGKSYTVETLLELRQEQPDVQWTLMIGSDMLLSFDQWRQWQDILQNARVCAVSREEGDLPVLQQKADALRAVVSTADIIVLSVRALPVSSTQIRENLQKNAFSSCLLPENVVQYIRVNGLYRPSESPVPPAQEHPLPTEQMQQDFLLLRGLMEKNRLKPARFRHSMNVAKEARKLAEKWGADPDAAYYAGMMHDCCKNFPLEEQAELMRGGRFPVSEEEWASQPVWHGIAAASYLHIERAVENEDILAAVRWHTVGHAGMSLLEEIIYMADLISEERDYSDVAHFRKLAYQDLQQAMLEALQYSLASIAKKGTPLCISTAEAYNYYLKKLGQTKR